eukprot:TRINITY_DN9209_c0_g1_i2.p1 TRINITY_DN9209_c0_g1~~TRINITY_DN9209_c0_g1_i2.p1  ORF type:complete len:503 (-),score=105.47 TRINITY_DN9209_c0_g1_i2:75-1583(-)
MIFHKQAVVSTQSTEKKMESEPAPKSVPKRVTRTISLNPDAEGHPTYHPNNAEQKKSSKKDVPQFPSSPEEDLSNTFDGSYPYADGPFPESEERSIPSKVLPQLVYASLSDEQKDMIRAFREDPEIAEWIPEPSENHYLHTDFYLSRYLVAREWNVKAAKAMYIASMKWRKENNISEIVEEFEKSEYFPLLRSYWPGSFDKRWDFWSFDNSWVTYSRIGTLDPEILEVIPANILVKYHIYCCEIIERKNLKIVQQKGYSPGIIMIEDMSGLGLSFMDKALMDLLKQVVQIDSDYYPAMLRKFFLINTPGIFTIIWNAAKPFFDPSTLTKFEVLGGDTKKSAAKLQEIIPEKYLPAFLGGKSPFEMPSAGSVKELTKLVPIAPGQYRKTSIGRNISYMHPLTISQPLTCKWEFKIRDEVFFGIDRVVVEEEVEGKKESRGKVKYVPVLPKKKINSKQVISGSFEFAEELVPGKYVLVWVNDSFFPRDLFYRYTFTETNNEDQP